jgi:hypothetical protein
MFVLYIHGARLLLTLCHVPCRTRVQMRTRYYRMKKSEEDIPGLPKVRKSKKQRTKEPVDPEPREEGIGVQRPDMMEPVRQSSIVASATPSIVPGLYEVPAYHQPPTKELVNSELREEGIHVKNPVITHPVGQATEVESATPSIVPGFHAVPAGQQAPTKGSVDPEPSEEGICVARPDITQPVEPTVVASAIPSIVPGFHTVRAFRKSPTKEHEDDSEPREEGLSAQSLDI